MKGYFNAKNSFVVEVSFNVYINKEKISRNEFGLHKISRNLELLIPDEKTI